MYIASSQNSIRTLNILSASVITIRRRNKNTRGQGCRKLSNLFRKALTVPKIVAQCRKRTIPYLYTLRRTIAYALPNAIACLNTSIPYPNTCITYLNTLTRISAVGSIFYYIHPLSQYIDSVFGSGLHILYHTTPILIH